VLGDRDDSALTVSTFKREDHNYWTCRQHCFTRMEPIGSSQAHRENRERHRTAYLHFGSNGFARSTTV
jgi:hypothetical protein